jgi:hypothetical protein
MDYVMDTLVLSRLIHPDLYESDQKRIKRKGRSRAREIDPVGKEGLLGSHSPTE